MEWHYLNSDLESGDFEKDKIGYMYGTNRKNITKPLDLSENKLAAFDLDHTVITTKLGNTFAKDCNDWKWFNPNVPYILNKLFKKNYRIIIITNQGGIKQKKDKLKIFQDKMDLIEYELVKAYSKIKFEVFCLNNKDVFRKPFPTTITTLFDSDNMSSKSFYCGDAAGRTATIGKISSTGKLDVVNKEKDFSNSDIKFAFNARLRFCTPEFLFNGDSSNVGILNNNLINTNSTSNTDYIYKPLNKKPELIIMVGYPGSGKSYIAKQIIVQSLFNNDSYTDFINSHKIKILSLDELKTRTKLEKQMKLCIANNYTMILDNTSLSKSDREKLINLLIYQNVREKYTVRAIVLNKNIDESFHMNCYRYLLNYKTNPKFVPEFVYKMMRAKYDEPNTKSENIDVIDHVNPGKPMEIEYYFHY
jgi:bifunctional polynucleotide phosphatase/kinase